MTIDSSIRKTGAAWIAMAALLLAPAAAHARVLKTRPASFTDSLQDPQEVQDQEQERREREQEARERKDDIDEAHHDAVDAATRERRRSADEAADDQRQRDHGNRDGERQARAV